MDKQQRLRRVLEGLKKYKYAALVLLLGLALLLLPFGKDKEETSVQETVAQAGTDEEYAAQMEQRLTQMLLQVEGAGRVSVMLTLDTGARMEYQSDVSTSSDTSDGNARNSQERKTVILSQGSAYDEAAVSATIYPRFQGALVVSEGADNAAVRLALLNAVAAVTGLGADHITIVKMK